MTMTATELFQQGSVDATVDLEKLGAAFAEFRQAHTRGTRIPEELRAQVARALSQGIPGSRIEKLCRLSWGQVKKLKPVGVVPRARGPQPRVLSVVDEESKPGPSETVEIGIGPWRVSVTRAA
jgi:hypothetical protein